MTQRFDGNGDASNHGARANGSPRDGHVTAELVAAYADQELESGSAFEVERHVGECPTCQGTLGVQRAVRDRLRQEAAPGVPFALRDRVFAAVRAAPAAQGISARGRARARRRPGALIAALARHPAWAAAAVLALTTLVYSWGRFGPGGEGVSADRAGALAHASSDSTAILSLILDHAAAWNKRDAKAAAALLTADAVWVTSAGVELRGREAIEQAHAQWLARDSAAGGTTHVHPPGSITVRFLSPDIAVADLEGQFVSPAAVGEPPTVLEQARIFVVATRGEEGWRIAQLRNMRRQGVGTSPR